MQDKYSENKMSPLYYTLLCGFSAAWILVWYRLCLYMPIPGIYPELSRPFFWIFNVAILIAEYCISHRYCRKYLFAIFAPLFSVGIYTLVSYAKYQTALVVITIALSVGICAFLIYLAKQNKRRWDSIFKVRLSALIIQSVSILLLLFMMLIQFIPVFQLPIIKAKVEAIPDDSFGEEYSVTANADSLSAFSTDDETWKTLSLEEKVDLLQLVANAEKRYLGLPHTLSVRATVLGEGTFGRYSNKEHLIEIDIEHLKNSEKKAVLNTLVHEAYHAYERQILELYKSANDEQKNLMVFQNVEAYIKEFDSYTDGSKDFVSYYYQKTEQDARKYSDEASTDIIKTIDENKSK